METEPQSDSALARSMYRAGYLAGWTDCDDDRGLHPDLTDVEVETMVMAYRMVTLPIVTSAAELDAAIAQTVERVNRGDAPDA